MAGSDVVGSAMGRRALAQAGTAAGLRDAYATPKALPAGPFAATWESLRDGYRIPRWFNEAKFGIFMHWGLYSIPARINEWYIRHMYTSDVAWHTEHYGAPGKFGYKDFIPLFKPDQYHADEWVDLFVKAGARYVVAVAEHHDGVRDVGFGADAVVREQDGPKRDLIGGWRRRLGSGT